MTIHLLTHFLGSFDNVSLHVVGGYKNFLLATKMPTERATTEEVNRSNAGNPRLV